LALLRGEIDDGLTRRPARSAAEDTPPTPDPSKENVWQPVEALGEQIQTYMAENRIDQATHALLDLERHIREAYEHLQECNAEGAAVEVLRNMIALFGTRLAERPAGRQMCLEPLVSPLLELRALFREQKQWQAADAVRGCLHEAGIVVEDSSGGVHWYLEE